MNICCSVPRIGLLCTLPYDYYTEAFDTISHPILFGKLSSLNLLPISWICQFLTGRTHSVIFGGVLSDWKPITGGPAKHSATHQLAIPVVIGNLPKANPPGTKRHSVLIAVKKASGVIDHCQDHRAQSNLPSVPSLYVLNATALTKPHAVEQLADDISNHGSDVAVVTETHCKTKHMDSVLRIPGYTLNRRDRLRRRSGGVAIYVRDTIQTIVWTSSVDDRAFELHWQKIGDLFVDALCHPPRPLYTTDSILNYIEESIDELNREHPMSSSMLLKELV